MLVDSSRFAVDSSFEQLQPKYKLTPLEIELFLKECIKNDFIIR